MFTKYRYIGLVHETKLHKYFSMPAFLSLLTTKQLYFSSLSNYEDALEGQITKGTETLLSKIISDSIKKKRSTLTEDSIPEAKRDEIFRQIEEETLKEFIDNSSGKNIKVNCWFKSSVENYAMWKLYGNPYGALIVTSKEKLEKSLDQESKIVIATVSYIKERQAHFLNDPIISATIKRNYYSNEKEVRLILLPENTSDLVNIKLEKLIDKIILSPYNPEWINNIYKEFIKQTHPELLKKIKKSSIKLNIK